MSARRRSLVEGQVLCREGDPPGPLYVICSGSVRAYRRSLNAPDAIEELATLGPGDVVGELAPMLRQLRTATVQVMEPSEVLEVPANQLGPMLRRHDSLLRVLTLALKERASLTHEQLEEIATRIGVHVPREDASIIPVPPHDPEYVYPKSVTCPACGAQFYALAVQPRKDQPAERRSDFHQVYRTSFNPYDYEVWVCPNDLYAALPSDFHDLAESHRPQVAEAVANIIAEWDADRPDFNAARGPDLRKRGLHLALAQYRSRKLPPARVAAILHRLAWCERERSNPDAEREWLAQALEAYTAAYNESDLSDPRDDLRVLYLCGELSNRLGDANAAIRWFSEALRHSQLKDFPSWERLIREQWSEARSGAEPE